MTQNTQIQLEAESGLSAWKARFARHPRLFKGVLVLKRLRTKVGLALALYCLVEGLVENEVPHRLDQINVAVVLGLVLVIAGLATRLAAFGCLKKKEVLATTGIYALCRHPLYLGSMLMVLGFCILLQDAANFVFAALYFATFYTVAILWEEVRVRERYGAAHEAYCRTTPLLIPWVFRSDTFSWRSALAGGGIQLIVVVAALLGGVQLMATLMMVQ